MEQAVEAWPAGEGALTQPVSCRLQLLLCYRCTIGAICFRSKAAAAGSVAIKLTNLPLLASFPLRWRCAWPWGAAAFRCCTSCIVTPAPACRCHPAVPLSTQFFVRRSCCCSFALDRNKDALIER